MIVLLDPIILLEVRHYYSKVMRTSLVTLGKKWGGLAVIRGTTKYHISPFEQKAFAGAISKGVPNTLWRFRTNVLYWAPRKLSCQIDLKLKLILILCSFLDNLFDLPCCGS